MSEPRYFTTAAECSTPEGVHRRFSVRWSTEDTDLTIELRTLYEPNMDESITSICMQKEGAEMLCELLFEVLHNRHALERRAVRREEEA